MSLSIKTKGVLTLISGLLMHFMLGSVYSSGLLSPYLISYLKQFDSSLVIDDGFWFYPSTYVLATIFMYVGGLIEKKTNIRISMLLASLFVLSSYTLLYFSKRLLLSYVAYSLFGIGLGLGYLPPIRNTCRFFEKKKGLVTGIIVTGFGISAVFMNLLINFTVNPNNKEKNSEGFYPEEVYRNVQTYILYTIIIFGSISLLSILLSQPYKDQNTLKEIKQGLSIEHSSSDQLIVDIKVSDLEDEKSPPTYTPKIKVTSLIFSWTSFHLFCLAFCIYFFPCSVFNTIKFFTGKNTEYVNESNTFIITIVLNAVNGTSRILWGTLLDKFCPKVLLSICLILELISSLSFYWTIKILPLVYINIVIIGLCASCVMTLIPALTYRIFGTKYGSEVYGFIFLAFGVSTVVAPVLSKILDLSHAANQNPYLIIYSSGGLAGLLGFIIVYFLDTTPKEGI